MKPLILRHRDGREQVVDADVLKDTEYLANLAQQGFLVESGGDVQLNRLFAENEEGNVQRANMTFRDYYTSVAFGRNPVYVDGEAGANLDAHLREQEVARADRENPILPAPVESAVSVASGAANILTFGMSDVARKALTEAVYGEEEAAERLEAAGHMEDRNPISYGTGQVGGFLAGYLLSGGAIAGASLARLTPGGLSRAAGMGAKNIASLSRVRLGANSALAGAIEIGATAIAEDVVGSLSMDVSQMVAGKENFTAEQILARAGSSAVLGLGIEGAVRGGGALFGATKNVFGNAVRGANEGLTSSAREALEDFDIATAIRQSDEIGSDMPLIEHMEQFRERIGRVDNKALVSVDPRRALAAESNLAHLAGEITDDVKTALRFADEALDSTHNSIRRNELWYKPDRDMLPAHQQHRRDQTEFLKKFKFEEDDVLKRIKFAGGATQPEQVAYRVDARAKEVYETLRKKLGKGVRKKDAVSGQRAMNALLDAQEVMIKIAKEHPKEVANMRQADVVFDGVVRKDTSIFRVVEEKIEDYMRLSLSPEAYQLRAAHLQSDMFFEETIKQLDSIARIKKSGERIKDFDVVKNRLKTVFRDMKRESVVADYDKIVGSFYELRKIGKQLDAIAPGEGAAVMAAAESSLHKMLRAYQDVNLAVAIRELRAASDEGGKVLATTRSLKSTIASPGNIMQGVGAALGGLPGYLLAAALSTAVRPIARVEMKAGIQEVWEKAAPKFEKGLGKAKRALRGGRITITGSYMGLGRKEKQEQYEKDWRDVQYFKDNQLDVLDSLAGAGAPLVEHSYPLAQAVQTAMAAKQAYIAEIIPTPTVDPLVPDKVVVYPSETQLDDYMSRKEILDDPYRLLEHFAAGTLSAGMVEAAQMVYPETFADIVASLAEVTHDVAASGKLDYRKRVQLQIQFGIGADPTVDGSFIAIMQNNSAQTEQVSDVIGGAQRGRPSTRKMALTENSMPVTARLGD